MTLLQPILKDFTHDGLSDRTMIAQALRAFLRKWQKTAGGESLITVEAPVGLLLSDLADLLNLTHPDRNVMLGGRLAKEVNDFMEQRIRINSPS